MVWKGVMKSRSKVILSGEHSCVYGKEIVTVPIEKWLVIKYGFEKSKEG